MTDVLETLGLTGRRPEIDALCRAVGARLLLLFGSQARGKALAISDVDSAVEFDEEVSPSGQSEGQEPLIVELMRLLGRNDVDVAVLSRSSALLRHRAATEGVVVFEAQPGVYAGFLVRALRDYDDTRSLREATRAALETPPSASQKPIHLL